MTDLISTWLFLYRVLAVPPYFWCCKISPTDALRNGFLFIFIFDASSEDPFNARFIFFIASFWEVLLNCFFLPSNSFFLFSRFFKTISILSISIIINNVGTFPVYPVYLLALLFSSSYRSVLISGTIAQFYFLGL